MTLPLLALSLLVSNPVQTASSPLEIGVDTGARMENGTQGMLALGLRLAYAPLEVFAIELEGAHLASSRGPADKGGYTARGQLVGRIPAQFSPFVLVGGGALGRPTEDEPEWAPSAHWGGGLDVEVLPAVRLRVQAKHVFAFETDGVRQDVELMVGFGFGLFHEEARLAASEALESTEVSQVAAR